MKNETEKFTAEIISQHFGLEVSDQTSSLDKMRLILTERIDLLLRTDPEKLFSILYRIDVSESKVKESLESNENPSAALARLIMDRQAEKVKARMQFGKNEYGDW